MRRHLLFLAHFCCPAASPINQSSPEARQGMSLPVPLALLDSMCVFVAGIGQWIVCMCHTDQYCQCVSRAPEKQRWMETRPSAESPKYDA